MVGDIGGIPLPVSVGGGRVWRAGGDIGIVGLMLRHGSSAPISSHAQARSHFGTSNSQDNTLRRGGAQRYFAQRRPGYFGAT